jgi:cell division protein FtsZ
MIEFKLEQLGAGSGADGAIPVAVIGIGGAGSAVVDQLAVDGIKGAELASMNSDVRALEAGLAPRKVQLGRMLTQGLGCGGDPELGEEAAVAAMEEISGVVAGRKIVFLCVGLGGGVGSGAGPVVARAAREAGATVVVFASMPFGFEGRRRRQQAGEALEALRGHANALITFESDRMGEAVLPEKGIAGAFEVADRTMGQSIRAVGSLVNQTGLIGIGMDDLMDTLRHADSRCLFGYGEAEGEGRAGRALELALESPMVDRGERLREARQVLVHICGGKSLTLFEIEGLMKDLGRHVGEGTQIRFGAAVDGSYGEAVSVTVISLAGTEEVVMEPVSEVVREEEKVAVVAVETVRVEEVELPLPLAEEERVKGVDPHAMVPMPDSGTITMSSPAVILGVPQPLAAASVPVVEEAVEVVEEKVEAVEVAAVPEAVEEVVEEVVEEEAVVEEEEELPVVIEEEVVVEPEAAEEEELPAGIEEKPRKIDLREILKRQVAQSGGGERKSGGGGVEGDDDDEPVISLRVPEPARVTPIRPIPAGTPVARKEVPVERVEPESGRGVKGQVSERTAAEQAQRNFDDHLTPGVDVRGRFDKGEPTVEEGENLDIPTFLRKKHR